MLNAQLLQEVLVQYKRDFTDFLWKDERFKWEAVKHFQDHWDINSPNFREMFEKATEKTYSLLASMNFFRNRQTPLLSLHSSGALPGIILATCSSTVMSNFGASCISQVR